MNLPPSSESPEVGRRDADGFLPLDNYGVLGDGRSVALSGADGSIDWWCVPHIDSPPLFDRLLDAERGGYFSIAPVDEFTVERRYREDSNVLETVFNTRFGRAVLTESQNSGAAGRQPWAELARRVEGIAGTIRFAVRIRYSSRADTINPYCTTVREHRVFHADRVLGLFLHSDGVIVSETFDDGVTAHVDVVAGQRETLAIIAGEDEPLVVPPIEEIDRRIDVSDDEWKQWTRKLQYEGPRRVLLARSALALKLLLFSPSGAIAAAATTSLPEKMGSSKNYDYRYAWVRDAGYTIKAFLRINAQEEAKSAFTWLLKRLETRNPKVLYSLRGDAVPDVTKIDLPGYRRSTPVVTGNAATVQHQHGIFGDIFETASVFVHHGNILDSRSAQTLSRLADECAESWRRKDAGIWELEEPQHYTMSKISAWQALARAVELADAGQLPTTCRDRWERERDRIELWIGEHCWSEEKQAFVFYPGSDKLDASLALAVRFRFNGHDRLRCTVDAIQRELGAGPYHYRYTGAEKDEGCFLACTFWQIEARHLLGQHDLANAMFDDIERALDHGVGVFSEMADPRTGEYLGNLPQGLTHLAVVHSIMTLSGKPF
jgi:GH15 family glucan-1,4-alpha-glucosidase